MFKAILDDPKQLKNIFNAIGNIIDTIKIEADTDGIRLNAMDRGHITFIHLELEEAFFRDYECLKPELITVDSTELMKILKRAKNDDEVLLEVDEGNLEIVFHGASTRRFKIRLIDTDYESPEPPIIEHPVNLEVPSTVLKDMINDVKLYGDKIRFVVDEDYLHGSSEGDLGEADTTYLHGERIKGEYKSSFSIGVLEDMLRAEKLSDCVEFGLGNDAPLTLKYVMDDGELSFLLAPRIGEE